MHFRFKLFGIFLFIMFKCALAGDIALDSQSINIQDALRILARFLHLNIIISPHVQGTTTLHLQGMSSQDIFDLILLTHNLSRIKIGQTWFIEPRTEAITRQQQNLKLQQSLDELAPLQTQVLDIRYAKAEEMAMLLMDNNHSLLSKRGSLHVDSRTNSLCIQDLPLQINTIQRIIKKLDIPVQQVVIEARLASIDNDYERELGVHFAILSADKQNPSAIFSAIPKQYSLAIAHLADGSQLDVQLAALENAGHGELISSPRLFTANQQTASIESGEEIPYQETNENGATSVAFKKAVLRLKVTPQILPKGRILLQLQVNQDRPNSRLVLGVPAISTRQITTNVLLENGRTIVLGGIYESNSDQAEKRIPFLGKIPLVGWLFKQQNVITNKRELLIFVTPRIIPQLATSEQ